ncbi:MAG TPA: Crp/Fnr family transcriptional regulator [Methylophilaceae bacterium]|nr:Crp/Fnr family transcriptional regulator [Methylophilaceae bacterium]
MPSSRLSVAENRLLAALPRKDRLQFLSECDLVDLEFAQVISEPQERIHHVYFPIDSFVSFVAVIDGNNRLEVGMAGNEGMVGTSLVLGVATSSLLTLVQGAGSAWRMKATVFKRELERSQQLQRRLNAYVHVRMSQLAQSAACTHFHLVEERLVRWLLMTQDRAQSSELFLTQEFLSQMLGVRRVGISNAATNLQKRGLISYSRGKIQILNRAGLIAASCQCYQADIKHYRSVLG